MRVLVLAALLAGGCLSSQEIRQAQRKDLECWQNARRQLEDNNLAAARMIRDICERYDLDVQDAVSDNEERRETIMAISLALKAVGDGFTAAGSRR